MGRFKERSGNCPIYLWLIEQGFEERSGAKGEEGLTKVYLKGKIYYAWVTIDLKRKIIHVYEEYDCGGCISEGEIIIQNHWLEDLNTFIDEVDNHLGVWLD